MYTFENQNSFWSLYSLVVTNPDRIVTDSGHRVWSLRLRPWVRTSWEPILNNQGQLRTNSGSFQFLWIQYRLFNDKNVFQSVRLSICLCRFKIPWNIKLVQTGNKPFNSSTRQVWYVRFLIIGPEKRARKTLINLETIDLEPSCPVREGLHHLTTVHGG